MLTRRNALAQGFLAISAVAIAGCSSMPGANTVKFSATLSGMDEVPPITSAGTGTVEAILNTDTNELKWTVVYSNLSGPVSVGHFHGPALIGQKGAVALMFQGSLDSPITGIATITPAQAKDLMAGMWYVNLHTQANPGGEIRAQLLTQVSPQRTQPMGGY